MPRAASWANDSAQLLVVLDEDDRRARVLHDVADLFRGIGLVDGDAHRASVRDAEIGHGPFDARGDDQRNPVPRLHATRDQAPGGFLGEHGQLRPGERFPDSACLA